MHAVTTAEDVDQILAPGGPLEAFKTAKAEGKVKALGFSAHDEAQAVRLIETGEFDTVRRRPPSPAAPTLQPQRTTPPHSSLPR